MVFCVQDKAQWGRFPRLTVAVGKTFSADLPQNRPQPRKFIFGRSQLHVLDVKIKSFPCEAVLPLSFLQKICAREHNG
jgi:hypothetical protein